MKIAATAPVQWVDIPGAPYQVSNTGLVRRSVGGVNTHVGRVLKPSVSRDGYLCVDLRCFGPRRSCKVHRLVAAAFIGPRPDDHEINHKNGDKTDNRLENLEYVTHTENMRHAHAIGLMRAPQDKRDAKLTPEDVRKMRSLYAAGGINQRDLAALFGVEKKTAWKILKRRTWSRV